MSEPTSNTGSGSTFPGGPPMVKIDGATVRRIREEHGLTQLYVATVVQVTTDTISRWENRRYPSIKKENAEKLAEALGVGLAELLEREEQPPAPPIAPPAPIDAEPQPPPAPAPLPSPRHPWRVALLLMLVASVLATAWYRLAGRPNPVVLVTATRVLPAHVPPGQDFPVLLRVSSSAPTSFALIVRETLPAGCQLSGASPAATAPAGRGGQINWLSRLEGGERQFAYRLHSSAVPSGATLLFQGQVVAGTRGDRPSPISGAAALTIAPYHWADRNGDGRIDDEEILRVYDLFGDVAGFADLRDEVDRIWTAGGYRWDATAGQYRLLK